MKHPQEIRNALLFIGGGIVTSILVLVIECLLYSCLGYSLSFEEYDYEITQGFVKILLSLWTLVWSIVAVIVAYNALSEQRKQTEITNIQHFENEYYALLCRQWDIRKTLIYHECIVANNPMAQLTKYDEEHYFEGMYYYLRYLYLAIVSNISVKDYGLFQYDYETYHTEYKIDWETLEHENPRKYEDLQRTDIEYLRASYVASVFYEELQSVDKKDAIMCAFKLVYERFRHLHHLYYQHIVMIFNYLYVQTERYPNAEGVQHYLNTLRANLTIHERLFLYYMVKYYGRYIKIDLIKEGFFDDIQTMLIERTPPLPSKISPFL